MDKPRIKTIKIFQQFEAEGEKFIHFVRTFDEQGNKLSEISYSDDEEVMEENTYSYNSAGKLIQEKNHFIVDEVVQIQQYEYDENGRLNKKHKKYGEEGDEDTTTYSYSASGNLTEKLTLSSDGELEHLETWQYDADKLIEAVVKNYDGTIMESAKFSYSDTGELKEEIRYTSETDQEIKILYDFLLPDAAPDTTLYSKEGKIIQRTRHSFDEKKRLVKEVIETVSNGVQKFTTEFSYDEQGNKIESRLVDKNDNLISKIEYKYDSNQFQKEEIHFEKNGLGEITLQTGLLTEYEFFNEIK